MGLDLVQKDQKPLAYRGDGFTIFYQRMSIGAKSQIIKRNTKRGITDSGAAFMDMARYAIVGWQGVTDGGQPVEFDRDLIARLPSAVTEDVVALADEEKEDEDVLGNSSATPASSPTTAD